MAKPIKTFEQRVSEQAARLASEDAPSGSLVDKTEPVAPGAYLEIPPNVDIRELVDPVMVARICSTCKGWRPFPSDQAIGQCIASAKSLPAPLVTTDMGSCSKWAAS